MIVRCRNAAYANGILLLLLCSTNALKELFAKYSVRRNGALEDRRTKKEGKKERNDDY